jgi:hypothetical protein
VGPLPSPVSVVVEGSELDGAPSVVEVEVVVPGEGLLLVGVPPVLVVVDVVDVVLPGVGPVPVVVVVVSVGEVLPVG